MIAIKKISYIAIFIGIAIIEIMLGFTIKYNLLDMQKSDIFAITQIDVGFVIIAICIIIIFQKKISRN